MNLKKKQAFNGKMGRRKNLSRGGLVKRKHYDAGGTVLNGPSPQIGSSSTVNNNGLTGTIGNALGLNNQYQAQSAQIQPGTNVNQINTAYTGAQGGINQQQAFANQLQAQGAQGMGTQQALTGELQGVINGTGPNAAQAELNQNTGQNIAQTAALMAGQRGAGANTGLLARQAGQQGAATQQNAVGQAATLQAQQQIAAQQQLQNLAATQVGQQAGAIQGVNSTQQNEQNILQGANTAANNANVAMQSNINNVNSNVAAENQQQAGNVVSGIGNMLSNIPVIGSLFAEGGEVHPMASGGPIAAIPLPSPPQEVGPWLNSTPDTSGPASVGNASAPVNIGNPFGNMDTGNNQEPGNPAPNGGIFEGATKEGAAGGAAAAVPFLASGGNVCKGPHASHVANFLAQGGPSGKVPAMLSPGEHYLNPEEVSMVQHGADPLKIGTRVPGSPKVKGAKDSYKNDTVPADLEEGGVVLPRHITLKKDPNKARLFVLESMKGTGKHMKNPNRKQG